MTLTSKPGMNTFLTGAERVNRQLAVLGAKLTVHGSAPAEEERWHPDGALVRVGAAVQPVSQRVYCGR